LHSLIDNNADTGERKLSRRKQNVNISEIKHHRRGNSNDQVADIILKQKLLMHYTKQPDPDGFLINHA